MKSLGWIPSDYKFHCDECDKDIDRDESYLMIMGLNLCEDCFENHKRFADEYDEDKVCALCGRTIEEEVFEIGEDFFCMDCINSEACETTPREHYCGNACDMDYEGSY